MSEIDTVGAKEKKYDQQPAKLYVTKKPAPQLPTTTRLVAARSSSGGDFGARI